MKRVGCRPAASHKKSNDNEKDPIQVYCRLRPVEHTVESSCVKVVSETDLQIYCLPNERGTSRECQFSYKKIFSQYETQDMVFQDLGLPLVEQLLKGKSSLLLAYGISGSGKSYTMTGNQEDDGIVGRSFDVIFNSIKDYQARKFTFKPDKLNGYDAHSVEEAMIFQAKDIKNKVKNSSTTYKKKDGGIDILRVPFNYKVTNINQDSAYSVFISYVEIYHNYVYDLLEDVSDGEIRLNSKIIREDSNGNMYVHGVNEQEVVNPNEAIESFRKGQLRKRTAPTFLNTDSSRSHTVFTVRIVKAPLDIDGLNVIQDKKYTVVSQLSLVDLAGSERTDKAKTTGQRLQEAGGINNSLSNLKQCLRILYENQSSSNLRNIAEKIPYRTSRLTHLFKSFFEGSGSIRILICINSLSKYSELLPVLQFGEISSNVKVKRTTPLLMDIGLIPGRRKMIDMQLANTPCVFEGKPRTPLNNIVKDNSKDTYLSVLNLGPPLPEINIDDMLDEQKRQELINALDQRIKRKDELREVLINQSNEIRAHMVLLEFNNSNSKQEVYSLQILRDQDINKIKQYQNKVFLLENEIASLKRKLGLLDSENKKLKSNLNSKENMLNQVSADKDLLKQRYNNKIIKKQEQLFKGLKDKWKVQENEFEIKLQEKKLKLKHIKNVAESIESLPNHPSRRILKQTLFDESSNKPVPYVNIELSDSKQNEHTKMTLKNLCPRRSKSCDPQECWIEHKPPAPIPLNTVMQPKMKNCKSVTNLTDAKTVTNNGASKYCLMTQGVDEQGNSEAKLYKADIIQTMGGGAQIVFHDIETLKQDSSLGCSPVKHCVKMYNDEIRDHATGSDDLNEKC
ncbi:Kinesin motor domain, conserved site,P-loop containing nucleoside triphosphate hydrolase,Kinesin motor [Cinara cedri]|uniref:Kinesin-like protein n=1 Tax=Cinara cedri TaxID=506608 RepID=A0A5E4NMD3_9HEMI|nr:Kinesin motor domain, conserved site,P-loop containing nucleoside triphosphate hydrolase,Kinesin motor [Cinara cedri]